LSRRPGRIKAIVPVPIPQRERQSASAESEMRRMHDQLWDLIKTEAQIADREVVGV
jgi:NitT/TauT family transport system ATP-binding protein